jgi:hypothetical protein
MMAFELKWPRAHARRGAADGCRRHLDKHGPAADRKIESAVFAAAVFRSGLHVRAPFIRALARFDVKTAAAG